MKPITKNNDIAIDSIYSNINMTKLKYETLYHQFLDEAVKNNTLCIINIIDLNKIIIIDNYQK